MKSSQVGLPGETFLCDCWPSTRLSDLFERVANTRTVTSADRAVLLAALFNPLTPKKELRVIDRLSRAIYKGKVKMEEDSHFSAL